MVKGSSQTRVHEMDHIQGSMHSLQFKAGVILHELCKCQRQEGTTQQPGANLIFTVAVSSKLQSLGQHLLDTCCVFRCAQMSSHS
jgi:hypothetical protein